MGGIQNTMSIPIYRVLPYPVILPDQGIVKETDFVTIQQRVDKVIVPPDIGHIPHKISSGFSSFTADQWKNWVIYYSIIAMSNILSTNILECWRFGLQSIVLQTANFGASNAS